MEIQIPNLFNPIKKHTTRFGFFQTNPNKVYLLDENNETIFTSQHKEKELREGDDHPEFFHAFNAYTPAATIKGDLVYVHYARVEDLQKLRTELSMDLKGKICLARYGKINRGNKVKNCQDAGAIGVVLFSDPGDVALLGTEPENVYPNTIFLPGSGIQRGSTSTPLQEGDRLSPGWPSVKNAYRLSPEDLDDQEGIPKIPAQPIG